MRVVLWAAFAVACGSSSSQALVLTGPDAVVVTELGPVAAPTVALSDGSAPVGVSYVVSQPAVLSVDASGAVTALGPGKADVQASWSGQTVQYTVTVDVPLMLRFVSPPATLPVGGRDVLHVEALLSGANVDPGELAWSSSDTAVLTVTDAGQVEGVSPGIAYVTSRSGTAEAMLELRVE